MRKRKETARDNGIGSIAFVTNEVAQIFDEKPSVASITVFTFLGALTTLGFGHEAIALYLFVISVVSAVIFRKEINKKEIIKGIVFVSFVVTLLGILRLITGFSTWHGDIPRWQSVLMLVLGVALFSFAVFTHWILSKFEK